MHNTYFTLPVVFAMLSNHYAMTYTHPYNWAVLLIIMLAGALIRQFFVMRHRGQVLWYLPLVGIVLMFGAFCLDHAEAGRADSAQAANAPAIKVADIAPILQQRCATCHSAHPTMMGSAPAGVLLDTPDRNFAERAADLSAGRDVEGDAAGQRHAYDRRRTAKIAAWFQVGLSERALALGGGAVLLVLARVRCWSFLLATIGHCAWRQSLPLALGGRFCLCLREFDVGVSCLALLATVRGGTSFLFPTAKKKRSKENAYRRQPVASALAQSSSWSESRTVLADANARLNTHPASGGTARFARTAVPPARRSEALRLHVPTVSRYARHEPD